MYCPMMIDLTDKKIMIIGGGKIAYRKLAYFAAFEAQVTVISEKFIEAFEDAKEKADLIKTTYDESYLEDSYIVVAATNNKEINRQIGAYCKAHSILCNVASDQALSSFIMPSFIKRGELVMSVSTGGNSPLLAGKIKRELEAQYPTEYEQYIAVLGQIRAYIVRQNYNEAEKANILNSLLEKDQEELEAYLENLENMK